MTNNRLKLVRRCLDHYHLEIVGRRFGSSVAELATHVRADGRFLESELFSSTRLQNSVLPTSANT